MNQKGQEQQSTSISSNSGALASSEKGTKKTCKILIPVLVIIALAGVGFGIYGMFFKPEPAIPTCPTCVAENTKKPEKTEKTTKNSDQKTNKSDQNSSQSEPYKTPPNNAYRTFENIVNKANANGVYFSTTQFNVYNSDTNTTDNYYINCKQNSCEIITEDGEIYSTISNFSGKIRDYTIATMSTQQTTYKTILFILEDGAVEYMPIFTAFKDNNIQSYGRIPELKNIVRIHDLIANGTWIEDENRYFAAGGTTLAEDSNGNFYDLYKLVYKTE